MCDLKSIKADREEGSELVSRLITPRSLFPIDFGYAIPFHFLEK